MNRNKKSVRRGGTSNQVRVHNEQRNRPLTRQQSASFLVHEEVQNNQQFALIQLISNKKILTINFNDLTKLNERLKIKLGSQVLVEINDEKVTSAFVLCIGRYIRRKP